MSEDCIAIIDRIIEERHNRGMTQKDLAKASSLTQSVIARLESKKVIPKLDTLLKVVSALECDIVLVSNKLLKQSFTEAEVMERLGITEEDIQNAEDLEIE